MMSPGTDPTTNPIVFEDVHCGYGRRGVLQGATLTVPAGSLTLLLGTNGVGKTTLLRLGLGVLRPRAGRVSILGKDPLRDAAWVRARVGFVPDKPDAYPWMTASGLLRLLAPHYPTFDAARGRDLLERLSVPEKTPFRSMSRGQGMKAMLAGALAHDPDVLLLDEPLGGLDPIVRDEVMRCVIGAVGERRRTILMATHDLDAAVRLADRVAVLHEGRIVREGPVEEFTSDSSEPAPEALRRALVLASEGS